MAHYKEATGSPVIDNKDLADAVKYIAAAGLAGGSLSLLTGAVRMLQNQTFRKVKPSDVDDDTLYVVKKAADGNSDGNSDHASITTMLLAGLGAPLALGGGFMAGNWLVNAYLRNKAQKELDEAQKMFVNAQGYDLMKKTAGAEFSLNPLKGWREERHSTVGRLKGGVQTSLNAAALIAALLTLGAGVTTYQYLKRTYPFAKPEKPKLPKKIEYVDSEDDIKGYIPVAGDAEGSSKGGYKPTEKEAAFREDNCMELAARFLCDMDKEASVASGVIHTVAAGRLREFEKAVNDLGFTEALNITKGASARPVNRDARELATIYCTKMASFAPQFRLTVASDFNALHPHMMKEASEISYVAGEFIKNQAAHLETAACMLFAGERGADTDLEKKAACKSEAEARRILEVCIEKLAANSVTDSTAAVATPLSDDGVNQNSVTPEEESEQDSAAYVASQEADGDNSETVDAVDEMFAPGTSILSLIGKNPGSTTRAFTD